VTEAVILIGIPGSGKSTFYRQRFAETHVRINLDMLRTRHREAAFLETCLATRQRFVVDNTNATAADRVRYIAPAKAAGFTGIGYYFESKLEVCLARNAGRAGDRCIPERGVRATAKRPERPSCAEGFDRLYYVRVDPTGGFTVEDWRAEVL
jgi:predicted kinase